MFTGLIEAVGRIESVDVQGSGRRLRVASALGPELRLGDSVAVSGVCLTVTACDGRGFSAEVSPETLTVTSLGAAAPGRIVNLERPLRADARLGGHFVLGHVDAVGEVVGLDRHGDFHRLTIDTPREMAALFVPKGSVAVDGVSLTIASLTGSRMGIEVVPFTFAHTSLREARQGDVVNLEGDVLGKYVARLMATQAADEQPTGAHS